MIALAGLLLGGPLVVGYFSDRIPGLLADGVERELADAGAEGVTAKLDGRYAELRGAVATEDAKRRLVARVASVDGVAGVEAAGLLVTAPEAPVAVAVAQPPEPDTVQPPEPDTVEAPDTSPPPEPDTVGVVDTVAQPEPDTVEAVDTVAPPEPDTVEALDTVAPPEPDTVSPPADTTPAEPVPDGAPGGVDLAADAPLTKRQCQDVLDWLVEGEKRIKMRGARVLPESEPTLRLVASVLRRCPEAKVTVEGYTDPYGEPDELKKKTRRWAFGVRKHLMALGIPSYRLKYHGRGFAYQKYRVRALNRRVEFRIEGLKRRYSRGR